ncbi:hypothetical protein HanHA300_Chr06g0223701 [Helianthus annuus]|nr:hypothetical protein HanHA300_Chr06g0223701 [Helianthus annuus]KAJ0574565.1 hypothetical protein HanHA89_Chr06g0239601 [Helianthus annuus]KAJ0738897.1 hypothetical protein HanLR1_Chr06g0223511 [Helianthus annuus]KAJ0741765.1 hypothetical protein HanOQP8_Chr06g0231791 [Helianthus annuus]
MVRKPFPDTRNHFPAIPSCSFVLTWFPSIYELVLDTHSFVKQWVTLGWLRLKHEIQETILTVVQVL